MLSVWDRDLPSAISTSIVDGNSDVEDTDDFSPQEDELKKLATLPQEQAAYSPLLIDILPMTLAKILDSTILDPTTEPPIFRI